MSRGYIRIPSDEWAREHYRATWTREDPAPAWWICADVAWSVDQRTLPSAREAADLWGISKDRAARLIREHVTEQAGWEARAERRAAVMHLLEEWAAKEPKAATSKRRDTEVRQERDRGPTAVRQERDRSATGDHGETPINDLSLRQGHEAAATGARHIARASSGPTDNRPTAGGFAGAREVRLEGPTPPPEIPPPVRLPDGREAPGDLPALLDQIPGGLGRLNQLVQRLVSAGFLDTRRLLGLPAGRLRFQGKGLNDADERDIDEHLRARFGVGLGALTAPPTRPPASGPGPPRRPTQAERRSAGLNALDQAAARLATLNPSPEPR